MTKPGPFLQPNPREVPFEPRLEHPPLTLPSRRQSEDPVVYERRLHAEYLNMWIACRRALCRASRRCLGTNAVCLFENDRIVNPIP